MTPDRRTAVVTKERVKQILEQFNVIDPKVDILENRGLRILAAVVSPSYEEMEEGERQAMVWGKLPDELGDQESRWVEFVYTDSPGELKARHAEAKAQAAAESQP